MPKPSVGDIIRLSDLLPLFDLLDNNTSKGHIGQIIFYSNNISPQNTLICDGSEISRDTYSELFNVIGTIYGEGDSVTTFNLPDLRDQWILCAGTEHETGENIEEGLPNITGVTGGSNGYCYSGGGGAFLGSGPRGYIPQIQAKNPGNCSVLNIDASCSSAVYGASDHVTPKSIVLTPCIIYE